MATSTKESLGNALKKMLTIKPIDKITVKDLVEECGVNRQTFYYHFDDVYDLLEWVFEEDANRTLPQEILYENWRENVLTFFHYLYNNKLLSADCTTASTALLLSLQRARTSSGPTLSSCASSMQTALSALSRSGSIETWSCLPR